MRTGLCGALCLLCILKQPFSTSHIYTFRRFRSVVSSDALRSRYVYTSTSMSLSISVHVHVHISHLPWCLLHTSGSISSS